LTGHEPISTIPAMSCITARKSQQRVRFQAVLARARF
jgi:hypothetical protein